MKERMLAAKEWICEIAGFFKDAWEFSGVLDRCYYIFMSLLSITAITLAIVRLSTL